MTKTWKTKKLKILAHTFAQMDDETDILLFLRDVCTLEELDEISSRFEVAQLLLQGKPYRAIAKQTGVSTATITRIAHWIKEGEGGYEKALKK